MDIPPHVYFLRVWEIQHFLIWRLSKVKRLFAFQARKFTISLKAKIMSACLNLGLIDQG